MARSAYFLSAGFLFSWLMAFFITHYTADPSTGPHPAFILRIVLLTAGMTALFTVIGRMRHSKASEKIKNYSVGVFTILLLFFLLEIIFMFIPYSHGSGTTLGSCAWFRRYWHTNKLGYRDREVDLARCGNKKKILVTGDSFVAGHGIENPDERFTGVLEKALEGGYCVFNAGRNGADTRSSYNQLISFPIRPDLIILSHHPNDIETLSIREQNSIITPQPPRVGRNRPEGGDSKCLAEIRNNAAMDFLVENSYFLEYASLKLKAIEESLKDRSGVATKDYYLTEEGKKNYLARYLEEQVMRQHLDDLYRFVQLSEAEKVPLIVVLFPETGDAVIDYSEEYVNRPIAAFLSKYNIPVLDTYEIMKQFPERERVVNWSDAHPSIAVHSEVGKELGRMVEGSEE